MGYSLMMLNESNSVANTYALKINELVILCLDCTINFGLTVYL